MYAKFLIKRHRILSLIIARNGLTNEQACNEVSRFESFVSKEAIDQMCQAMGHPQQGICGKITHDEGCRHPESTIVHGNRRSPSGKQETN